MIVTLLIGAVLIVLILGGVWIAFAIGVAGTIGLFPEMGPRLFNLIGTHSHQTSTNFTLTAIPLFILMGEAVYRSGLTDRLFSGLSKVLGHFPGGLVQANIGATALFAASSGSSVAAAAALGPMIYEDEVKRRGYNPELVLGSLAAGGTLGILIPPSVILILYGAATGTSVGRLFAAGLIPGLISAGLTAIYVAIRGLRNPSLAPVDEDLRVGLDTRIAGLFETWPFILLAVVVLGSIYGGIATPTEAAAVGALAAFTMAAVFGELSLSKVRTILLSAVRTTSMIVFIIISANVMSALLTWQGVTDGFVAFGADIAPFAVMLLLIVMYLVLGVFFDAVSMMILTLPFALPMVLGAGMDPVWFGILLVTTMEFGLLTPPVGLNLFVIQGVTGANLLQIVRGAVPFLGVQALLIAIIALSPEMVLWLPNLLFD